MVNHPVTSTNSLRLNQLDSKIAELQESIAKLDSLNPISASKITGMGRELDLKPNLGPSGFAKDNRV